MKRFAVLTIAIVMSVLFAACRNDNNSNVPAKQTSQSTEESTTSTKKSTKESTTKSTSAERTTRASESETTMDQTNEDSMGGTELAPYETDNMNNNGIDNGTNETSFNETGSNFDDLFEEGTVSNGSGEGVIDQIGDDIMR